MAEIAKVCIRHGELTEDQVRRITFKKRNYVKCHQCEIERSRRYYKEKYKDPEFIKHKHAADSKRWREKKAEITAKRNTPEARERRRLYNLRTREKQLQQTIIREKKLRDELADTYVKKAIKGEDRDFPRELITPEMVEVKRLIMKINRTVKKLEKGEEV